MQPFLGCNLWQLIFNLALKYTIRKVEGTQEVVKLIGKISFTDLISVLIIYSNFSNIA
jgi:hypothetical protein